MKSKFILLILSVVFCSYNAEAQRTIRIGYIDMDYILENVPEYKQASAQLEGKVQKWRAEIELKMNEVDAMKKNLENERPLLTKELIEDKEDEIKFEEQQIIELKQQRFGPSGDMMTQKRQLVQPVQDQVFTAVQEIATNRNYDIVFDKAASGALYTAERHNISDQVVRMINRTSKREQITSKEDKEEFLQEENRTLEQDAEVNERQAAIDAKRKEREEAIEERRRQRDSIKTARQNAYEEERARKLAERQRRKDSIAEARKNK